MKTYAITPKSAVELSQNPFLDQKGLEYLWAKILSEITSGQVKVDEQTIEIGEDGKLRVILDPNYLAVTAEGLGLSASLKQELVDFGQSLADLKNKLTGVYTYKGSKATTDALSEVTDMEVGDVYNVTETDMNYAWTGTEWDPLGSTFHITAITNAEIDAITGGGTPEEEEG